MTKHTCFKVSVLMCAVSMLWSVHPVALAQLTTGRIVGVVTDSSGAAVPGATVTLTQVETAASITVTTDPAGNYSATALKIGMYTVSAEQQGFQRVVQSDVNLGIGQVLRVDFVLKVGVVTQTVNVTGAPQLLQSSTSSLGTIETEQRIVDLPLNGRNFFKLAYLGPGANEGSTGTSAGAGSTDNNRPGTALSVNGLRIFDNNFLLDGLDNNEFGNGTVVIQPPPDSIQEFRVEENSMNAEFGRGGAMVNIVLRSGTNKLHGSAWEFLRNNKLDARNFFAQSATSFQRNQYGGQLGGPIVKDRMFIFGSIQRSNIREEQPFISTVPTQLMRTGDLSELGIPIYDPLTTDPNNNNVRQLLNRGSPDVIPGGRISPVGQAIVNLFPLPNVPGAGVTNNFIFNGKAKFDETAFETRFDYNISSNDRFFAHYAIATPIATNPSNFPNVTGGLGSGTSSTLDNRVQSVAGDWTHIFNPSLLNDLRAGFLRFKDATLPLDFGTNFATEKLGVPGGIPNANHGGNSSGLTKIQIANFQALGDSLWVPETIVENVYQLADTLSWTHGKHSLKFGADFRRQQRNFFQQTAPSGWLVFNGQYTNNPADKASVTNPLADTLLGFPSFTEQDHLFGTVDPTRYWDLAEFVQDDIRVTPNLTLNVGLRYEISSPAAGPTVGNFDLKTATVNTSSHGGVGFDKNDWAPRLGFAWTVRPTTVIRSGGGIFYAPEGNIFDDLGLNPPSLAAVVQNFSATGIPQASNLSFPASFTPIDPNNPTGIVRSTGTAQNFRDFSSGSVRRIPRIYEWNLTVEQQFAQNWAFRVGYVGTRSSNLFDHESSNFNQPLLPLDSNFNGTGPPSTCPGNFGRPYYNIRNCLTTIFPLDVARLSMSYHALQTSVEHRFSGGFNVLAAYTFAKSLGTADGNVNQCGIQNAHNLDAEKGPVTPDFRHRLSVSYVYELPYGKGKRFGSNASGVAQAVLGGWQVAGVTTARSGEAFDAVLSGDVTNTGAFPARPDIIHNPRDFSFNIPGQAALKCSNPGHQTLDCWFNQAAFVLPPFTVDPTTGTTQSARQFGNAGRAILRGPDMVNFDFSTYKTFPLGERFGLVFRAEFFNLFNHPNFQLPNLGSGGGSSGAGIVNGAGGAAITSVLPESWRQIQFGVKLQF
jgi:hypothetical protein